MTDPGLTVEIRKSAKRTKSAGWTVKEGVLTITVPAKWTKTQINDVTKLCIPKAQAAQKKANEKTSDENLAQCANRLREEILQGIPDGPITWSQRPLKSRWGSCAADGSITISAGLATAPQYVLDAVIAHELAHRLVAGHGGEFWKLVKKYPRYEEADAFLKGAAWGAGWDSENAETW